MSDLDVTERTIDDILRERGCDSVEDLRDEISSYIGGPFSCGSHYDMMEYLLKKGSSTILAMRKNMGYDYGRGYLKEHLGMLAEGGSISMSEDGIAYSITEDGRLMAEAILEHDRGTKIAYELEKTATSYFMLWKLRRSRVPVIKLLREPRFSMKEFFDFIHGDFKEIMSEPGHSYYSNTLDVLLSLDISEIEDTIRRFSKRLEIKGRSKNIHIKELCSEDEYTTRTLF